MKFYILLIFGILFGSSLLQSDEVKGKEFIATFLPNYHNQWNDTDSKLKLGDSIYLFIYSEKPTKVNIEYNNQIGQKFNENFNIPANTIYTFKKPSYFFALIGYNESGDLSARNNSERVSNLSFRIKSEESVIVYGHSQAVTTSESFNVLPLESLGNEYIVAAYNSSKYYITDFGEINGSTPSQFAIVATEDDTEVFIKPSASTKFNQLKDQTVKLNKNEVYLVQANISAKEQFLDLTGTYIKSNKSIAVFGGQQRAAVPYDIIGQSPSRDYLVEQIPTLESWTLECYIVPFPQPSVISTTKTNDVFRVIAGFDNTDIYVGDTYYGTLNKGKFFELPLDKAYKIRGSAPILVVSYKRTSQTIQNANTLGDPLMQINPSIDQYGNNYKFISIQAYQFDGFFSYDRVYTEHFITLIVPSNSLKNIELDGVTINTNGFKIITGTDYYYGYKEISEGIHTISAPDNFGLFVAGYGYANSYGYFSGILTKRDDFEPPTFQSSNDCYKVTGKIEDKKIANVTKDDSKTTNLNVDIEQFTPYVQELNFSAELINNKQDGKTRIIAKDSIGQQNYIDIDIPGFTVGLEQSPRIDSSNPIIVSDTLEIFKSKCFSYSLKNYGKFNQKIEKASLKSKLSNFSTDLPETFEMAPNAILNFEICFASAGDGYFVDTLYFENNCYKQDLVIISLLSKNDDNLPVLTSSKDPCKETISIIITDSAKTDRGIKELIIEQKDNLDILELQRTRSLISVNAIVKNPYEDSYLSITAIDSAGFSVNYKDTIQGFTIFVNKNGNAENMLDFGNKKIGIEHCENFTLTNYGNLDFTFDDVNLSHNIYFSLPLSQMPLVIKSGETKDLQVCFKGYIASNESILDTLHLKYNCLEKLVALESIPDSLIINNNSRCDVNLIFSSGEIDNQNTVSKIYPNPTNGKINFIINNTNKAQIKGMIYNLSGDLVIDYLNENYDRGVYNISLNANSLQNGIYYNVIYINNEKFTEIFIINK